jgi:hypothetical protein
MSWPRNRRFSAITPLGMEGIDGNLKKAAFLSFNLDSSALESNRQSIHLIHICVGY